MPLGLFLQTAPARDVLARMLGNLKEIHRSAHDWPRLFAVLERLVVAGHAERAVSHADGILSHHAGSRRRVALAIQQLLELGQLLVDRALDQHPTNP